MAEVIRLDPFQNITGVHWREPNTDTDPNTETDSDPPTDPGTEGPYPYFGIIQVLTGNGGTSASRVMEWTLANSQLIGLGVYRFSLTVVPVADLFVKVNIDRSLIPGWPSEGVAPWTCPGFYLVASNSPIVWPDLDDGSGPGSPQSFIPSGGSSWTDEDWHEQIITIDQSPAYRWFPYIEELVPEVYREQFSTWVVP